MERFPAVSPDGKQVAFSWNGPHQDNHDLYVKFFNGEEPLRLTTHPAVDGWPTWSPDGSRIVFVRYESGAPYFEFMIIPALGGAERKILEAAIPFQPDSYIPASSWTPDGEWIIAPIPVGRKQPAALGLISVNAREIQPLLEPIAGSAGDCCPAISPDGRRLAFLRSSSGPIWNIFILPLGPNYRPTGEPHQLTTEPGGVRNPMWTADSREVLYSADRDGGRTL